MKFYKTSLEKELLISKIKKNPSLLNLFKKQKYITEQINEDIKTRIKGQINSFCVILIEGSQGSLKSSLAQEIAKKNDETFNTKKISFLYNEFRDKLEKSKKGDWYILDEEVFLSGTGSMRILESLMTCIETLRQHGANLIIISPNPKYFQEQIFTHHLETIDKSIIGICEKNQTPHEIRTCQEKKHKIIQAKIRSTLKKNNDYIGFHITEINNWNDKTWQEYTKRKKEFLKKVLKEDFPKIDYEKFAQKIIEQPNNEKYKTSKQIMLLLEKEHPNLSIGEKQLIIEAIKIKRKENA